jgi:hypothetical protein
LNQAYEKGWYGNDIDYAEAPIPPLTDIDLDWLAEHWRGMNL